MAIATDDDANYSLALDKLYVKSLAYSSKTHPLIDVGLGSSVGFDCWDDKPIKFDREALQKVNVYGEPGGERFLRHFIRQHYKEQVGVDIDIDRVLITNGASEALLLAFMVLLNGKKNQLILPEFHYPCYRLLAQILGKNVCYAKTGSQYSCSTNNIASCINDSTGAIVVNSPSNPFGKISDEASLRKLSQLNVPIIADETYRLLSFDSPSSSLLRFSSQSFIVNSFSKSLAMPGIRLGYLIMPESYIDKMISLKLGLNISTSIASQRWGYEMIINRYEKVPLYRDYLRQNRNQLVAKCNQFGLDLASTPEGGIFAVLDTSRYGSSLMVADMLLKKCGVLCAPLSDFSLFDPGFVRINFSCPMEQLNSVLDRISSCLIGGEWGPRSKYDRSRFDGDGIGRGEIKSIHF
ncbi:MAG: pyridoxal phosphate-dependent aminotransferase [Ectothiorhodospiraceae bacterium]|nr:pyridoxal phosphate-dependent aminotransferase [Ectothiorhodospiraceae bacterium]